MDLTRWVLCMNIAIVEDHALTRDFVIKTCLAKPGMNVIADVGTGEDAIREIVHHGPDMVILDIGLPDIDGFDVIDGVRKRNVEPKFLIMSCFGSPYVVLRLEHARIQGFVDKRTQTADELLTALSAIQNGQTFFSKSFVEMRDNLHRDHFSADKIFTKQQMLILAMVAKLYSDEEISERLGLALRTIEAHRTSIMRKLEAHSRLDLIRYARDKGFI
jgi:two-component system, NarL family, response regulator NreC